MPLPEKSIAWPPAHCKEASNSYKAWDAWYSGDADRLQDVYQVTNGVGGAIDPKAQAMTAAGSVTLAQNARFFWGNPPQDDELRHTKLHIPLAGDIAATSADLLFGEPPSIRVSDKEALGFDETNTAIERFMAEGLVPTLWESAETGSALGGSYVRVTWDPEVADIPLWDVIPPDAAVPEWRSGRLYAVTFWREVDRSQGTVYRHLERHERGRVYHGLYKGDTDRLGTRIQLADHPETASFGTLVNSEGFVATGATGLSAEYFPNLRPNRLIRGSLLGRSDYAGIEQAMDALDETWSSLMRDVRLGKGRMIVPESYLEANGPGKGARFNAERQFFTPVKALPDDDGISLEQVQFEVRVEQHLTACRALTAQAVRGAGYSVSTFGDFETAGGAATATEIQARNKRSYSTRGRKIGYVKPPLARLVKAGLEIYRAKFPQAAAGVVGHLPDVVFPDGVQTDELTVAKTVQLLDAAGAVSKRTKIELVHPQWDTDRIDEELDAIGSEADQAAEVNDLGDMDEGEQLDEPGPAPAGPPTGPPNEFD